MGNEFGNKIGASILMAVMLLASFGIVGLGVSSEVVQDEVKAGPIQGLQKIDLDPTVQQSLGDNIPRITATERMTPLAAPAPETQGFFESVDTSRCVLVEFGSGIDNGSFAASYGYALDQAMSTYSRTDVVPMQLNSYLDSMLNPAYSGATDYEYSPGDNMFTGGYCDAAVRQAATPPFGADMFPLYLFPASLDPEGDNVLAAGTWNVDGFIGYDGSGAYYNDGDSSWDGRWDDAGGSGAECVQPEIDARLGVPSDFTMTLNGTFDDISDWGNVSLTISAINDMDAYDSNAYNTPFWVVDDYEVVETRTNPYNNAGTAGDGPSAKTYPIRNSMQQWMGIDDLLDGFLENRGEVVSYNDIAFNRRVTDTFGLRNEWNGNELGMIASLYDETTMECLQTVYYSFSSTEPDLAVTPVDCYYDSFVEVVNETVYGPATGGEMGPIYLANGDITDITLYLDYGEWLYLEEGVDYQINYTTGEIDISDLAPMDPGWIFYAYYNYSMGNPSEGDIAPIDITVSNAGNGAANNVNVGIYLGDPDTGILLGNQNVGNIPAQSTANFVYNWDTTGYPGFNTICVVPDYLDAITESNENNNIAQVDIYVAPPDDVGVVDLLTFEDGQTYEYGIYDIEAIIGNYGTTDQGPFTTNCLIEHMGSQVYLLNDNCEGGVLPGWTADAEWAILANGAYSPSNSWDFGNGGYAESLDSKLTFGPFDLSGGYASAAWSWWHDYDWEAPNWDGGVVEVSADGTAWTRVTPANGYDGAIGTGYGNVLEGETAYLASTGGFVQDSVDLTPWLGDATVWVRYWAGTDNWAGGGFGWRVDDIRISKTTTGGGVVYDVDQPTTMNPMQQNDWELMTWNYNFDQEAMYRVTVSTQLGSDTVATNDQIVANIITANVRAPFPPTDLTSQAGGAGTTLYQQASSDIAVNNGGIVNSYAATNMPADAVSEEITEGNTFITGSTEYTYNGITSPSGTHVAYRCDVDRVPPTGANLNSQTEGTTANYGQITNSDDTRWITADPGNGDENFMWAEFDIAENVADITEIVISFEGQGNQATNFNLWINDGGTWSDTGSTVACGADTDGTVIHSFTSGFATLIQGGVLTWGAYQTDASDLIRVDKANVTVRYGGAGGLDDNAVNWTASADDGAGDNDVDHYNIYRSDVEAGPWDIAHIIDTVPATGASSYSYIDLLRGQADAVLWWYVVRAVDLSANEDSNSVAVQEPGFVIPTPFDIDLSGFSAGDWAFVSYPIDISGNIEDILNDATLGDGQTTWDVAKWYNIQDAADPWKTYRFGSSLNDLATIDNTRGVWLHLTANGGDQILTTGLTGDYSAGAVAINLYAGWNMISYPSQTSRLASNTLPGQADLVAYYDSGATYMITDALPNAVTFTEGNGYWVHVTADTTWTVDP